MIRLVEPGVEILIYGKRIYSCANKFTKLRKNQFVRQVPKTWVVRQKTYVMYSTVSPQDAI